MLTNIAKKIFIVLFVIAFAVPSVSFRAFNDASIATEVHITANGIDLVVSGATAVIEKMVVNSGNFTFDVESGSSLEVRSVLGYQLAHDGAASFVTKSLCDTLGFSSSSGTQTTITVTPSASVKCGGGGSGGVGAGGGLLVARRITGASGEYNFYAEVSGIGRGGAGAAGVAGNSGGGGSGGGGGGGYLIRVYEQPISLGSINLGAAGSNNVGGAGIGTGVAGATGTLGSAGTSIDFAV